MKGKAVPAEIEPGAGADLMQAQRQAAPGRNLEEAAEEDGGAADLIGLRRMVEEASEQRLVFGEGSAEGGPELAVGASARRGQTGCKHRRLSLQRQEMQASEEAERQDAPREIALPIREERSEDPAGFDIRGYLAHGLGPERRAELGTIAGLPAEGGRQSGSGWRMFHLHGALPSAADSPLEIQDSLRHCVQPAQGFGGPDGTGLPLR